MTTKFAIEAIEAPNSFVKSISRDFKNVKMTTENRSIRLMNEATAKKTASILNKKYIGNSTFMVTPAKFIFGQD